MNSKTAKTNDDLLKERKKVILNLTSCALRVQDNIKFFMANKDGDGVESNIISINLLLESIFILKTQMNPEDYVTLLQDKSFKAFDEKFLKELTSFDQPQKSQIIRPDLS